MPGRMLIMNINSTDPPSSSEEGYNWSLCVTDKETGPEGSDLPNITWPVSGRAGLRADFKTCASQLPYYGQTLQRAWGLSSTFVFRGTRAVWGAEPGEVPWAEAELGSNWASAQTEHFGLYLVSEVVGRGRILRQRRALQKWIIRLLWKKGKACKKLRARNYIPGTVLSVLPASLHFILYAGDNGNLFSSDEDISSCVQGLYNKVTLSKRWGVGAANSQSFVSCPCCEVGLVLSCCTFHWSFNLVQQTSEVLLPASILFLE